MKTTSADEYEKAQNFNFLTKWLHSFRYKEIKKVFDELSGKITNRPIRVLEIGAAYGKLFSVLNSKYEINYYGIELFEPLYKQAIEKYGSLDNAQFVYGSCLDDDIFFRFSCPDIIIALETLEHIPEHDVVRLIEKISQAQPKLFVCSVPVEIGPSIILKNMGSFMAGYMRHKEYSFRETLWAGLYKLDKLPRHETGHKGFDWRWLAQTLRHNLRITKKVNFPLDFLPTNTGSSVFFVCEPYGDLDTGR